MVIEGPRGTGTGELRETGIEKQRNRRTKGQGNTATVKQREPSNIPTDENTGRENEITRAEPNKKDEEKDKEDKATVDRDI